MKQNNYTELSGSSFFNIYITEGEHEGKTWKFKLLVIQETPRNEWFGPSHNKTKILLDQDWSK